MEQNKEQLDKEFEEWLDSVELTKPMPLPKEEADVTKSTVVTDIQETR
jgi:hypothetical protein